MQISHFTCLRLGDHDEVGASESQERYLVDHFPALREEFKSVREQIHASDSLRSGASNLLRLGGFDLFLLMSRTAFDPDRATRNQIHAFVRHDLRQVEPITHT